MGDATAKPVAVTDWIYPGDRPGRNRLEISNWFLSRNSQEPSLEPVLHVPQRFAPLAAGARGAEIVGEFGSKLHTQGFPSFRDRISSSVR